MPLTDATNLGRYKIIGLLGSGGMGQVYLAHDERLRRDVAIKVLSADHTADNPVELILAEARAASALNHPAIVTIYDVGETGGQTYIVMELVHGSVLRQVLAAGQMETQTMLRVASRLAEALAAAHAGGVIHGDIKPANIIIQPEGRVKLLDFGIARRVHFETFRTTQKIDSLAKAGKQSSPIVGTFPHMAPEQLRGALADARSDLYSLGTVLYEMAAGHLPFAARTLSDLTHQILHQPPPPITGAPIPAQLAQIILALLDKNPDTRYPSADRLHQELEQLLRDIELGRDLEKAAAGKTTVAVLPFTLLTPGAEDEYLSVALADAAIGFLSLSPKLIVRPTNSVLRFLRADVHAAGRELNVDVIVDGTIQKYGQKLRVHMVVRRLADDAVVKSMREEAEVTDLFGLQDRLAEGLAGVLGAAPEPAQVPARPTQNALAYEMYLRAGDRMSRLNRWDLLTAIGMLENATGLDPDFPDAWGRLAEACVQLAVTFENKPKWFRKAESAIGKALRLDRTNADALCAKGQLLWTPNKRFENATALRALHKAIESNPGCHQAQIWLGLIFLHLGLHDDARHWLFSALATNPQDPRTLVFLGQTALYEGKYEEAYDYEMRALAIDPGNMFGNLFFPTVPLYLGRPDETAERIRVARQMLPGESTVTSIEALLWAHRGERRRAEQVVEKALTGGKPLLHTHHMWQNAAAVYSLTGKPAKAITWIRKAARFGLPNYPLFSTDPFYRPLHNQPAYLRLMAELKKEWTGYRRVFGSKISSPVS